ncbi:hypothetical protein XELAEV_18006085mg [Xenopus laevis]|uniref:Tyr recombinase domain-containing protein n=1 Tax=Xenopus laevis TaxID=8355 RepID=A0A974DY24_XENLA|nr:hypothetical protein XELAEV_18006085mg [Xenopus laevis]
MKGWARIEGPRVDRREPIIECRLLNSLEKKSLGKGLMFSQVLIYEDRILVYISRLKTDQSGKGKWVRMEETLRVACPVRAVKEYMLVRPEGGKLFLIHKDLSPISAFQFRQVLKKAVGWDPSKFGLHSFRIGAATEAALRGKKEDRIKVLERWRSKVYKIYMTCKRNTRWIVTVF